MSSRRAARGGTSADSLTRLPSRRGDAVPGGTTPPSPPEAAPAALIRVIGELLAAGAAAGAFDGADPDATAVLCYASMHAFDQGFRDRGGPDDTRLIRAAQQLFSRAAGVA